MLFLPMEGKTARHEHCKKTKIEAETIIIITENSRQSFVLSFKSKF